MKQFSQVPTGTIRQNTDLQCLHTGLYTFLSLKGMKSSTLKCRAGLNAYVFNRQCCWDGHQPKAEVAGDEGFQKHLLHAGCCSPEDTC